MKIAIIGTGYVGLVSGTCFAEMGNDVTCVDIDQSKIDKLKSGHVPIYEPGLELLIERNFKIGRLEFTTELEYAVDKSEIVFLALPTPPGEDGSADLSYVMGVADDLSSIIKKYTIVVNKSTVPVGTGQKVHNILSQKLDASIFDVVSNPEFLREGAAVQDFLKPDRVVIGCATDKAYGLMEKLYKPFVRQGNPIYRMDIKSAELTKYAANSYLAMRISYMNEIANICDRVGANVDMVRMGMGSDTRIGKRFLFPGIGYGGSCFPKDVKALRHTSQANDYDFKILDAVINVNSVQKRIIVDKIRIHFNNKITGLKIGIWGLAFKPETDDIREAPALEIIDELLANNCQVTAFDPEAMPNVQQLLKNKIHFAADPYEVIEDLDALVICTEWPIFRTVDLDRLQSSMKGKVIFDGRNILDATDIRALGVDYYSIGRP